MPKTDYILIEVENYQLNPEWIASQVKSFLENQVRNVEFRDIESVKTSVIDKPIITNK